MHLLDLPSELLVLVLKRSLTLPFNGSEALKGNLPLLDICSPLRQLSLPLVYHSLFLSYDPVPPSGSGAANACPDDQCRGKIRTNLDLVVAVGGVRLVRKVTIRVRFIEIPSPLFWEVIERMRQVAPAWSRVATLVVSSYHMRSRLGLREIEMDNDRSQMLAVGGALAELMPGLRQLECGAIYRHPVIWNMYGRVVGHRAGQLVKIMALDSIRLPADCRLDAVRDLRVASDATRGWRPPLISADALERLEMFEWSDDDLCSFIDTNSSDSSRTVVLPKLTAIRLLQPPNHDMVTATVDTHQYQQRLRLPALKTLVAKCNAADFLLWNSAVLPAHMDLLKLTITCAACESIAWTTIPKVRRLILHVNGTSAYTTTTLGAINRILERAGGHEEKGLDILDSNMRILPGSITCNDLTKLALAQPTSVDELLVFLHTQPKLRNLSLCGVTVDDIRTDVSIPSSDDDRLVVPLHMNLSILSIVVEGGCERQEQAVAVAKRLLPGLPGLTQFYFGPIPKQQIVDFVREYAHRYPHLANIDLQLFE